MPFSLNDSLRRIEKIRARELLEEIVASVLQELGFDVKVDRKMDAKGAQAKIEVDVWAEKRVGDSRFKIYVSCKNWNKDDDSRVVYEEFGRTSSLLDVPHLRILIVKSMNSQAKKMADANGFFVIELGEKATEFNRNEIRDLLYKRLSELFRGIAPPQLVSIAEKVRVISTELAGISSELKIVGGKVNVDSKHVWLYKNSHSCCKNYTDAVKTADDYCKRQI
ncbi:restriction endonuclease [Pyrolobus fumarii]|uniref:restriction endonuclease n=1 Tax=Pyrolobus fumarii TaxID=54252 RepID=UPI00064FE308|nr:restriction endonuclease [Pyrolobus fumarii]